MSGDVVGQPVLVCKVCGATFSRPRQLSGHKAGKHVRSVRSKNSSISLGSLSPAQVGYIAAFLDGEGGIQITRTERVDREYKLALHPTVYFTNTNELAITTLSEWIRGGTKVVARGRAGHKDTFYLHVCGYRNIQLLLQLLVPHLIIKAERARVMLDYCESRLTHHAGSDRRYNERELELYTALFTLNFRGVKQRQPTVV